MHLQASCSPLPLAGDTSRRRKAFAALHLHVPYCLAMARTSDTDRLLLSDGRVMRPVAVPGGSADVCVAAAGRVESRQGSAKPQAASKPAKAQAKAARNPPKKSGADPAQRSPAETGDTDEREDASDAPDVEEVEGGGDGGDGWTTPQVQALQVRLAVIFDKLEAGLRSAAQQLTRLCSD